MNLSDSSPISTIVGNNLSRGEGDTAFRDQIGDTLGGAMGTHIGNGQGIASNIISEYNTASMTEIQLNLNMIDAARGYDTSENIFSKSMEINSMDTKMEVEKNDSRLSNQSSSMLSGRHSMESSMYSGGNNHRSAFEFSSDIETQSVHNMGGMQGGGNHLESSMYGEVGGIPTGNNGRQEFVEIEKAQYVKNGQEKKINVSLNSDIKVVPIPINHNDESSLSQSHEGIGHASSKIPKNKKKKEEEEESVKLGGAEKSTGAASLRPFVPPRIFYEVKKKKNKQTQKSILLVKLSKMNDKDFLELVKKTSEEFNNATKEEGIKISTKIKLLGIEAKRRYGK